MGDKIIAGFPAIGRCRKRSHEALGDRIFICRVDLVLYAQVSDRLPRVRSVFRRIVGVIQLVRDRTEVTLLIIDRSDRQSGRGGTAVILESLPVEIEIPLRPGVGSVQLGQEDRTADIGSEVVLLITGFFRTGIDAVYKRVEGVVAKVFITSAVELFAATLGLDDQLA